MIKIKRKYQDKSCRSNLKNKDQFGEARFSMKFGRVSKVVVSSDVISVSAYIQPELFVLLDPNYLFPSNSLR